MACRLRPRVGEQHDGPRPAGVSLVLLPSGHAGETSRIPVTVSWLLSVFHFALHQYWGTEGSNGNPGKDRLRAEDESQFPVIFRPAPLQVDAEAQAAKL